MYFSGAFYSHMSLWKKKTDKAADPGFLKYKKDTLLTFSKDEWLWANGSSKRIYRSVYTLNEIKENGLFAELSFYNKLFDEEDWSCEIRFKAEKMLKNAPNTVEKTIIDETFIHNISEEENKPRINRGLSAKDAWSEGEFRWQVYIDGTLVNETITFILDYPTPSDLFNPFFDIKSIRLFESGKVHTPGQESVYYSRFRAQETRFINIRTELKSRLFVPVPLEFFFYYVNAKGEQKGLDIRVLSLQPGESIITSSWGTEDKKFWKKGKHAIHVVFMDRLIAQIPFTIGKDFKEGEVNVIYPGQQKGQGTLPAESAAAEQERSLPELMEELESLTGLQEVKEQIRDYTGYLKFNRHRVARGLSDMERINLHTVLSGNPGTGKTTVAKMLGSIYRALGLLSKGHVYEVDRSDLIGEYIGQTAPKVKKAIERARGGILFIDEAYALIRSREDSRDFGPEVIEILLKEMSDGPGDIAIVAAGYTEEMRTFIEFNPGLKSRFQTFFHFQDYNPDELLTIAENALTKRKLFIDDDAREFLHSKFTRAYRDRDKSFGNARYAISIVDEAKMNMALRLVKLPDYEKLPAEAISTLTREDVAAVFRNAIRRNTELKIDRPLLDEAMGELSQLIGLQSVKESVQEMVKLVRYYRETGRNVLNQFSMHTLYVGNPGTGKTTVARIMAKIFRALGVIERGHLIEADRSGLVAAYTGQTALKTSAVIEDSLGGILFIDEAYALSQGTEDSFGKEAVNTLLKRMEDLRDEFIVIAAGYPDSMNNFLDTNPGLRSRFEHTFHFQDYSAEELLQIALLMLQKEQLYPDDATMESLGIYFRNLYDTRDPKTFGNAREVRSVIQKTIRAQHLRMATLSPAERSDEVMETLTLEDIRILNTNVPVPGNRRPMIGFKP